MPHVMIVNGSQRPNAESSKVTGFVRKLAEARADLGCHVLDFTRTSLPMWSDAPEAQEAQNAAWAPIRPQIRESLGLVLVAPEWNGMAPPALKNFFLYCTEHELADRPAVIVGVSSGSGGASPATELRLSSYKDTQICYLPEQVIVRRVRDVLNDPDQPASEDDAYIRFRLDYALTLLLEYGKALAQVRDAGVRRFDILPYGM
ncbi:MAG: NAD(P)H-dependent oxidoreductase [Marivibrio sp.]|uniref:NAD(P)H-dependent oxidoreductase n=1 Tax=Marivibrio sp. TaxID=2039719 RepID=UPI0032EF5305